ncbi:type II toxin-antitoxin system RelE/ParE family toxin [Streptomyces sp. NPDC057011]|uniref:type II toxin-antitoxin system RelE/ParE family toxin n=1 Tax=unclassified Streptomyces TaxID=2593676 RepID=UPI00362CE07E
MSTQPSGYELAIVPEVREWLHGLRRTDLTTLTLVSKAITRLRRDGPALGRPLVDTLTQNSSRIRRKKRVQSRYPNMKELRPGSSGSSEVRILFIFDPQRRAVLLVAGDKAGNWAGWYEEAIPLADARYEDYLKALEANGS